MRIWQRRISSDAVLASAGSFEIIEEYPSDKYLPSYLVRARHGKLVFHVLFAADVAGDNVRVVTVYIPDPARWEQGFRVRRGP